MAGLFEEEAAPAFSGPSLFGDEPETTPQAVAYRVLARKYRPTTFDDLIGQDALVRTLRNAFAMNRIAHAFMLTGVRGVGKTTTARILARALNCIGPDGTGGPTPDPCGVCDNCIAILADRHPDVVEMDAASNTGVDDAREIIEATRFRPMAARTKVFIIDEAHMLTKQAFNALLKTLEEPPPHIKFVFATTEIRKVPVTVLSRCQRFDLRRVSVAELSTHFTRIAAAEKIAIAREGIDYIARAADGSVRDGLSLLDQAIARGSEEDGEISAAMVADMLGLADRGYVFDLMDSVMAGDAAKALDITDAAHAKGADLGVLLGDLLGLAHLLTRLKSVPALSTSGALPEMERTRGLALAEKLSIPWLGRLWQMLLKGVAEVESAPDRKAAAEMILIRLCHVADMPPPAELIKKLQDQPAPFSAGPAPNGGGGGTRAVANGAPIHSEAAPAPKKIDFSDVVALAGARNDVMLYAHLRQSAHLVRFAPPVIELRLEPDAPRDFSQRLAALLETETQRRWTIALSREPGEATIAERERETDGLARQSAADHPLVRAILATFPGARIESLHAAPEIAESPPPDWGEFAPPDAELVTAPTDDEEEMDP
jgi:DNA polymerase-3 subunit gamma/tau